MLRKYFAIFRTRALVHTFSPDGITRGTYKFYSFETKRKLYIRGLKEYDQGVVQPDFIGKFQDTEGFFYNADEYDEKKEDAIRLLTPVEDKSKLNQTQARQIKERNLFIAFSYNLFRYHIEWKNRFKASKNEKPATCSPEDFSKFIKKKINYNLGPTQVKSAILEGYKFLEQEQQVKEEIEKKKKLIVHGFRVVDKTEPEFEG